MASQVFTSDTEFRRQILLALQDATDYVVQKIWNENRELIQQIVYEAEGQGYYGGASAYSSNPDLDVSYERTGEFKEAWRTETHLTIGGSKVEGKMAYDPSKLTPNPVKGQHASLVTGEPMQSYLADIIYNGTAGRIFGEGYWTRERNAYAQLDKWLTNTQFRELFEEGMTRAGLPFIRKKAAIHVTRDK